ncbi:hypothetical protein [Larkinella rosea]|uniref:Outer membrane protein beta-barrel domain-containing protein n=1 Tax=Larkinella rosea TaxID=2025312 RepID=A0A3P1BZK8_9BACT|nr:hypothetical protein [Larkinella rosea]RRB06590.1 hypothetical protein EHT25_01970 [Larkinella rosea]
MKKLFLLAILIILPAFGYTQTQKGQGIWTGVATFNFVSNKTDQTQMTTLYRESQSGLTFSRGVFVKDNWLVGAGLYVGQSITYNESKTTNQSQYNRSTNYLGNLDGFVRRYWGKDRWRFFLSGGLSLGYGLANYDYQDDKNDSKQTDFSIIPTFQAGGNYYLTRRIGVEAAVYSNAVPLSFSSFTLGLVILTGENSIGSSESYEAPQTAKGSWVIGGSFRFGTIGFQTNRPGVDDEHTKSFAINPSAGWFIKKNLLLGISIPFQFSSNNASSSFAYGINPYLKKYISGNRLRPFIAGDIDFLTGQNKNKGNNSKNNIQKATLSASTGLAYLLGEDFILEATLGSIYIGRNFYPKESNVNSWNGGVTASLQPRFTIQYVFN